MINLPLPLVVSFALIGMALFVLWRHKNDRLNVPFLILILVAALQTFLVGLRWGFDVRPVAILIPPISAMVPSLVYCGIATLVRQDLKPRIQVAVHSVGVLAIIALMVLMPAAVDLALIGLCSGYAFAILLLMRAGSDALYLESFESVGFVYRSIVFAALSLLFYATLDAVVYFEITASSRDNATWIIAVGNISLLVIMAVAIANISQPAPMIEAADAKPVPVLAVDDPLVEANEIAYHPEELEKVVTDIETLLVTKKLFRDVGLNLDRLARRLGVPARLVSVAVNQRRNRNVSQFVNEFRLAEACSQLRTTDQSVTDVMFNVGFQTKSNFNREFRRVTGMTPIQWRLEAESSLPKVALRFEEPARPQTKPVET